MIDKKSKPCHYSGMMWGCYGKKIDYNQCIMDAIKYYKMKYKTEPKVCYMNPSNIDHIYIDGVKLIPCKSVLKNHVIISN